MRTRITLTAAALLAAGTLLATPAAAPSHDPLPAGWGLNEQSDRFFVNAGFGWRF